MNTQHTPGPWEVSNDHKPSPYIIRQDGRFTGFASVKFHDFLKNERARQEQEANARLIAAAPELLAALERLIKSSLAVSDLRHNDQPIDDEDWSSLYNDVMDARAAIAKATATSTEDERPA